ncbi:MAG: phosphoribosylanthranilate isomerase [Acidobacteria bacterium]|nr:phosphoribosylanthranilate isomerase [Acidobacteriota bacterium]
MTPEIIKVCGLTNIGDARFAAEQGATALGFIFFEGSPRYVTPQAAAIITATLPHDVLRVGVFVDEEPAKVRMVAALAGLNVVQLHGNESPAVCEQLRDLTVWKVFRVGEGFSAERLAKYECAAYFLDTASDGLYGGTGRTFPWPLAVEAKQFGPVIMAGGLDAANVGEAIRHVAPYGVDASSKLERKPGLKDHDKVKAYLEAARSAKE